MGKKLIITEKPSVAQDFARVLGVSGRNNGYIENNEFVITWCVGHLVEMVYPEVYDIKYKKWRVEDLPFLPKEYKYAVIDSVKNQYDVVHGMLHREDIDIVYWAGDSGKEGQTIEENIRNFGGVRDGMTELRVWIDSQTDEEIRRGIAEAKPMEEYKNLGRSGIMRSIEDYAMGINFSRAMSVKYGKLLNDAVGTASYAPIAVGRVMTCVLGMVVIREREIRNFDETPFYRITGMFSDASIEAEWKSIPGSEYYESPLLYKENGFKKREDAEALMQKLEGRPAYVKSIESNINRKKAPLLFNLAELQAECAKRFKISPDETLKVAQELYEKKLTTYPRTDARVLTTAVAKEISRNINRLKAYEPTKVFAEKILSEGLYKNVVKSQYTNDSKVTDHYAIIPTGQVNAYSSLSGLEKSVYDLIVRRFLSIFYPAAEYNTVKLEVSVDKETLFASAKVLKSPGYLEIAGWKKQTKENDGSQSEDGEDSSADGEENKGLIDLAEILHKDDPIQANGYGIKEGKTSPPKRYTSGSMVLAMENAGQLIEEEELREQMKGSGIGTSATRAEIIKKLVNIGYLNLNKKSQVLTPEKFGEMVFEVVNMTVPALLNPKMTASWEKGLDGITMGTVEMEDYREKLEGFIERETLAIVNKDLLNQIAREVSQFAGKNGRGIGARKKLGVKCPMCDGEIETTPFGYGCSNYKKDGSGCRFSIGQIAGKDLSEEDVKTLLTTGKTEVINGFISKNKKKFSSCLVFTKEEDGRPSIQFDFTEIVPEVMENVKCPVCGGDMEITSYGYTCANRRKDPESCYFSVGKIASKALSQDEIRTLIQNGRTETIRGFKSKSGNKFDACLVLEKNEEGKTVLKFDFDHVEAKVVSDVKCPQCGGDILVTSYGYCCSNHKRGDANSCGFTIGKIAEKAIPESQVKQLLTDGRTETLRGFKSKAGKKFDACLMIDKDENGIYNIKFDFDHVEAKKIKDVSCPVCGGDIVKTPFGFGCANYSGDDPNSCKFSIGKMAGKNLTESQIKQLLTEKRTETIRGFKSKAGKSFDARVALSIDEEGKVTGLKFDFDDVEPKQVEGVVCPLCGGKIVHTPFGFGCARYSKEEGEGCRFSIGQIASVKLKEDQVKELLLRKKTGVIQGFVAKTGMKFDAPLKLTEDGKVTFDFPEKQKPVESVLACPRCGKHLLKSQWYYECECGFKLSHTVAQVPLEENIIKELLETGKTKQKVTGFVSRSGSKFDTCLKYEDEKIQFDFDNPGEGTQKEFEHAGADEDPSMRESGLQEPAHDEINDAEQREEDFFAIDIPPQDLDEEALAAQTLLLQEMHQQDE